ncbi:MAG TPA: hypothetical protein VMZ91_12785 [Candidatus Paceibacterota bacterium]|nr:hypothetical protein [Candidatus Paceibacterota bacterium]
MIFFHPEYKIEIDTDIFDLKIAIKDLNDIYKKIPDTKCLHCPGKDKVEADCCKCFSPPMLLIEFLNILTKLEKEDKEFQKKFTVECMNSFLNPEYENQCLLMENVFCKYYEQRPFSCRMFGQYSDFEWRDKIKTMEEQYIVDPKKLPFYKQCKNIQNKSKKILKKGDSDYLFKSIYNIDLNVFNMFKEKNKPSLGPLFVFSSKTYLPIYTHLLLIKIGPDLLEQLAIVKLSGRKDYDLYLENEITKEKYMEKKKGIEDFFQIIKKSILEGIDG